jgi:hypothetical protein
MSRIDEALRRALFGSVDSHGRPKARSQPADRLFLKQYSPEPSASLDGAESASGGPSYSPLMTTPADRRRESAIGEATAAALQASPSSEVDLVPPESNPAAAPDTAEEKLIDFRQIAQYSRFLTRSLRRHMILGTSVFLLSLAFTVAAVIFLPKTYHAQSKLLAQRNAVMTALSNPGRAVPWDADAPTRAASETVLRRDNLLALITETDLVNEWERTRAPILKLKDQILAAVFRPLTASEKLDQLVGLLEARLMVVGGPVGDGTVTIDLDWPTAEMAYRLVEGAQTHFVRARQETETATIGESINVLERYAATLHEDIDRTMAQLQQAQTKRRPTGRIPKTAVLPASEPLSASLTSVLPPVPAAALATPALGADLNDPQIPRLRTTLEAKKIEINNLEQARQRQVSELQGKLAQISLIYSQKHPNYIAVQQSIEAASRDTPQLTALKAQAEVLEADYEKRLAAAKELLEIEQLKEEETRSASKPAPEKLDQPVAPALPAAPAPTVAGTGGDGADFASVRFRLELNQLESVLERIDGARIELAVSQAAFKYRYTIIRPAEVPKKPVRPNVLAVLGAGVLGGLMLTLVAVVGRDIASNRILEPWQVERQLGLAILGKPANL